MCELNYVNLHDEVLNKMYLIIQSIINSDKNQDGFGFLTANNIYRTTAKAEKIKDEDWKSALVHVKKEPIMAHTRASSLKNNVILENVHPFSFDKIVVAHNGTVEYSGPKRDEDFNKKMDSIQFGTILNENWDSKDPLKSLNETMKNFTGKCALLIYDIGMKTYYAYRGKIALLHFSKLNIGEKEIGWVINTQADDLTSALAHLKKLSLSRNIDFSFTEPKLMDEHSLYILKDSGPEKIGECKEREKVIEYKEWGTIYPEKDNSLTLLYNTINRIGFSLTDLDYLCFSLMKKGFLSLSKKELIVLTSFAVRVLLVEFNKLPDPQAVLTAYSTLRYTVEKKIGITTGSLYEWGVIKFPYFHNSIKEIENATQSLEEK